MSKTGVHFRGRHPEFQVFPFLGPLVFFKLRGLLGLAHLGCGFKLMQRHGSRHPIFEHSAGTKICRLDAHACMVACI